jgi:ATP-dependent DNA ligase
VQRHAQGAASGCHIIPTAMEGALRDGIQLSDALTGDGAAIFRHACGLGLEGIVSKPVGSRYVSGRTRAGLKTKNPQFKRQ